jgi:ABC-type Fe3+ transport system permease subunit
LRQQGGAAIALAMQSTDRCLSSRRSYAWPFIVVMVALIFLPPVFTVSPFILYPAFLGMLKFLIWTSPIFVVLSVANTLLSSACGCVLARRKSGGLASMQLIIALLVAVVIYVWMHSLPGLLLTCATVTLPFTIWRMKQSYAAIPASLDDAATLDGCSPWLRFRVVVFPCIARDLGATLLFSFAVTAIEYGFVVPYMSR